MNKISPYLNNLQLLILFQGLFNAFAGSYILIYFYNQSFPLYLLPLLFALTSGLALLTISSFKIEAKWSVMLGFCSYMLGYASLLLPVKYSYALYVLCYAFGVNFFWVTYNYLYFKNIKSENAINSSVYSFIPTLGATIVLPLGGYLIKYTSYHYLFGIAALLHFLPVYLAWKLIKTEQKTDKNDLNSNNNFHLLSNLKIMFQEYEKLRTITFLEGALQFFPLAVINVYTLLFFHEEVKYGLFLGYLGLLGTLASIAVSYYSDHKKERLGLLLVPFIFMSLSIFLLPLAKTQAQWIILVTITSILLTVTYPIRMALSMDNKELNYTFWRAREFFLNAGRMVTLGLSTLFFYYREYWLAFALFGVIVLLYPLVAKYKLKDINKVS